MMRPRPNVGDKVTMLPEFGDPIKCKVNDLLSMMFTATQVDGDRVLFLYYDRLKGDSWEYTAHDDAIADMEGIIDALDRNAP